MSFGFNNNVNYPFGQPSQSPQNNQNRARIEQRSRDNSSRKPPIPFINPRSRENLSSRQKTNQKREQSCQRPTYRNSKRASRDSQEPELKRNQTFSEPSNQGQALHWKEKGNNLFKEKKYLQAIDCYSKGIEINDGHSVLYSNRSRCYKLIGNIKQALRDIQTAIDLDDNNIKAYLMQGQLLAQQGKQQQCTKKIELAVVKMTKALRLCTTLNKPEFKDDTNIYLFRAKKLLWYKKYNQVEKNKVLAVQNYEKSLQQKPGIGQEEYNNLLTEFVNVLSPACTFTIPESLCCKISYELMEDPVTTESGHTYERKTILTHMRQNGKFDPFTRKPISDHLYPNLLAKSLIDEFVGANPWAYQYSEGQSYKNIKF